MRVLVTKQMETIEISDDETDPDEVQIVEVTPPHPPPEPPPPPAPPAPPQQAPVSSDSELEAALAGLDKETEKQVHGIVQEITKHVESDMWRHAYQTSNEEKKVN